MKVVVGVADMRISNQPGDVVVTHALGSCLGLAVHDPQGRIGGILHVMLPQSQINPEKAKVNPYMFVDTGVPAFFNELMARGAVRGRLVVKLAGGANVQGGQEDRFAIGKRNYLLLRKMLWKNNILVKAEEVGGSSPRTMYLDVDSGRTWLLVNGQEKDL
ncbi:MAG: chemotaxis protein CheD [Planctomycetaceae bacterium]|nr:chemotaxis protein CheD [Planctomycetaceae bacterium]